MQVQNFDQDLFDVGGTDCGGRGFYSDGALAEGLTVEAMGGEFIGDARIFELLRGRELQDQWHEQLLYFEATLGTRAQHLFKENAFVGYVLIDDPEPVARRRDDETVVKLSERTQIGQRGKSIDTIPIGGKLVESRMGIRNFGRLRLRQWRRRGARIEGSRGWLATATSGSAALGPPIPWACDSVAPQRPYRKTRYGGEFGEGKLGQRAGRGLAKTGDGNRRRGRDGKARNRPAFDQGPRESCRGRNRASQSRAGSGPRFSKGAR